MQKTVIGLGELLWDLLPDGKRLGGAPANFAVMAGRLGDRAVIASRIARDTLGLNALELLLAMPVETGFIQQDDDLPTGTVTVELKSGEPHYTIHEPVAWDRLQMTEQWRSLAQSADAVCFGTLAQREPASRIAITEFLDATRPDCVRIFDVNLRAPYWSPEILRSSFGRTTLLKLNASEVPEIMRGTGVCPFPAESPTEDDIVNCARRLMERYPVKLVCVTLGVHGSLLITRNDQHRHPGIVTAVQDTVGAGDAFTAALAHHYLEGAPLPVLNEAGNRWGAWVASQAGGMPELRDETVAAIRAEIEAVQNS